MMVRSYPKTLMRAGVKMPPPLGSTTTLSGIKYTSSPRFSDHFLFEPGAQSRPSVSG